jgi:predicted peroxiredoxin
VDDLPGEVQHGGMGQVPDRQALDGVAAGVACDGCPPLADLLTRYETAGGRLMVCPVCFNAKQLDKGELVSNAELAGSVQLWEWNRR